MSFAPGPDPEKPHLNGTHPLPSVAHADPRDAVDCSSTIVHSEFALWLMSQETGVETHSDDPSVAAERVCQQLVRRLSRTISSTGFQAILSTALHVTQAEFPFLEGVHAGRAPETCLEGLRERVRGIEPGEAARAVLAVLSAALDVLVDFIGEDLTFRLVHEVWLDVPVRKPRPTRRSRRQEG